MKDIIMMFSLAIISASATESAFADSEYTTFADYDSKGIESKVESMCQLIRTDPAWGSISERAQYFDKTREKFKENDISIEYENKKILNFIDINIQSIASYDHEKTPSSYLLMPRVINKCGMELQASGKINLPSEVLGKISSGEIEKCIQASYNYYKEIAALGEDDATKEEYLLSEPACFDSSSIVNTAHRFPYYLFFADGANSFQQGLSELQKSYANGKNILEYLDNSLITANSNLTKEIGSKITSQKNKEEKEVIEYQANVDSSWRLEAIQNGELSEAISCQEIASALVKTPLPNLFNNVLSNGSQEVKIRPTSEAYAVVATLISFEKDHGITFETNDVGQKDYAAVLRFNKTLWFNEDNIAIGKRLYYVGVYADNQKLSSSAGSDDTIYARVYDVICASGI